MKINLTLLVLLLTTFICSGQLDQNYSPVLSQGEVPEDFVLLSGEKYQKAARENKQLDVKNKERKVRDEFSLMASFAINQTLLSGQILFNDAMSDYINKVADIVLEDDRKLREELRFYTVRSPIANAFSTNQGIIFITTGLLAQLQNEAQLAFIISHEVVHYEKDHTVNSYLVKEEILSNGRSFDLDDAVHTLSSYSKDLEMEADDEGFLNFLNTGYDLEQAVFAFDVLHYSYLPFEEVPFEKSFLETEFLKFPSTMMLDSVQPITVDYEDFDDSNHTHPNIASRKEAMWDLIDTQGEGKGKKFLLPKEDFEHMRDIARFEVVRLNMMSRNYPKAIYNSYLLLHKYPENRFLKRAVAKSLYGLAVYKTFDEADQVTYDYEDIEGQSQKLHFLISEIDAKPMTILALRKVMDSLAEEPDDQFMVSLKDDLIEKLVLEHEMQLSDFTKWVQEEEVDEFEKKLEEIEKEEVEEPEEEATNSKYASISKERKRKKEESRYYLSTFSDKLEDTEFVEAFTKLEAKVAEEENSNPKTAKEIKLEQKKREKRLKKEKRRGKALGVDKLFLVNPYLLEVKKGEPQMIKSEQRQLELNYLMTQNAEMNGIECYNINAKDFKSGDLRDFNYNMYFKAWLGERINHEDMDIIPLESDFMYDIVEQYGIENLSFSGLYVNDLRHIKRKRVILWALSVYGLPISFYHMMQPGYESVYFNFIFNLKTGEEILADVKETEGGFQKGAINRWAYDQFWQLSREPEPEKD